MRKLIWLIAMLLTGGAVVNAQTKEPQLPRVVTISPFEVARTINKARTEATELNLLWESLAIDEKGFEGCGGYCRARIWFHELDGRPGAEVVVMVSGFFELSRYLIFTPAGKQWELLGYIDHTFNKYEMSRHRVEHTGKDAWLVIRAQEGSGSGFALYADTWYQVNANGVRPVLTYPADGHTNPGSLGVSREFVANRITRGAKDIAVRYTVTYSATLFDKRASTRRFVNLHRLTYSWDEAEARFILAPSKSDVSEAEIAAIANIESDDEEQSGTKIGRTSFYSKAKSFAGHGYEVFLKNNSAVLMKIATGRNSGAKEWLRHFLEECDDIPEKKAIAEVLK
jgi:hypothetical protein